MPTVGIISDTHGLLRPEAADLLKGSDLIIHGGDIGSPDVVERLSAIAPVIAIRGNVDKADWAKQFPSTESIDVANKRIYVLHNLKELDFDPTQHGCHVVISGHSHKPSIQERDGVLYINPGSAGPRRFKLPISLAKLEIEAGKLQADICELMV